MSLSNNYWVQGPAEYADLFSQLLERLSREMQLLPDKPEETVENTLRALWQTAAGHPMAAEAASTAALAALDENAMECLKQFVDMRIGGVPLAHITGRTLFMQVEFLAGPEALVPRRETELLGYAAMELLQSMTGCESDKDSLVIDVCTGAGNLAVALALSNPSSRVYASDLSEHCVELSKRNIAHLNVGDRVVVSQGDLLAAYDTPQFHRNVDLITCNPPYISSSRLGGMNREIRDYEPRHAFDGGPFGVSVLMRIIKEAPRFLKEGGWLAVEVGLGQGQSVTQRMERSGDYRQVRPVFDSAGHVRCVLAEKQ